MLLALYLYLLPPLTPRGPSKENERREPRFQAVLRPQRGASTSRPSHHGLSKKPGICAVGVQLATSHVCTQLCFGFLPCSCTIYVDPSCVLPSFVIFDVLPHLRRAVTPSLKSSGWHPGQSISSIPFHSKIAHPHVKLCRPISDLLMGQLSAKTKSIKQTQTLLGARASLLVTKGIATRSKDATSSSWP